MPQRDWDSLILMTPDYADIQAVIDVLKQRGFTEDDFCALNRKVDGANVGFGPIGPPPDPGPYRWEMS